MEPITQSSHSPGKGIKNINIRSINDKIVALGNSLISVNVFYGACKWENRVTLLNTILADLTAKCQKEEPLTIISLGSERMLMEYVLLKGIYEAGFKQTTIYLIDPLYKFANNEELKILETIREKFCEKVSQIYKKVFNEKLPINQVKFLSRMTNLQTYFSKESHIAILESIPPYGEMLNAVSLYKLPEKQENQFFVGSFIVPEENANAVSFLPKKVKEEIIEKHPSTCKLPFTLFKNEHSFGLDAGCKIYNDGSYYLSFYGLADYFKAQPTDQRNRWTCEKIDQLIEKAKLEIDHLLLKNQESCRESGSLMNQNEKTELLKNVIVLLQNHLGFGFFEAIYLADYHVDKIEMLSDLKYQVDADHRYGKIFTLLPDPEQTFLIREESI
jgi:hypothetical protein